MLTVSRAPRKMSSFWNFARNSFGSIAMQLGERWAGATSSRMRTTKLHLNDSWVPALDLSGRIPQSGPTHLEFEALHPFKDGNGRLGRMVIPLFLYERRVLSGPNFYMSDYLEAHREQYVEAMRAVSRDGAWTGWCAFFLEGLIQQASENQEKAQAILGLYQEMQRRVIELTHSQHAGRAVEFIFSRPIFASPHFVDGAGIPRPTAQRVLVLLRESGILATLREGAGRRAGIYAFSSLLNIAEGRRVL